MIYATIYPPVFILCVSGLKTAFFRGLVVQPEIISSTFSAFLPQNIYKSVINGKLLYR
jgi:hypothetical protein